MNILKLGCVCVMVGVCGVFAKSYTLETVTQDIYLQPNGSVVVKDARTFDFEGQFSRVFLNINPKYSVSNITAAPTDGLKGRLQLEGNIAYIVAGPKVGDSWPQLARDQKRSFVWNYTLNKEITIAKDAVLLDRQIVDPKHQAIGRYVARIHAPKPIPDLFKVFIFTGRGAVGKLTFDDSKTTATISGVRLAENEPLRVRVIASSKAFDVPAGASNAYQRWLEATKQEAKPPKPQQKNSDGGLSGLSYDVPETPAQANNAWYALLLAPLAALGGWIPWTIGVFRRYGKEPTVTDVGKYYREPAQEILPAMVPYVLSQDTSKQALGTCVSATLLDFCRRGVLSMQRTEHRGLFGTSKTLSFTAIKAPQSDSQWEQQLYQVLTSLGEISPTAIGGYFKHSPQVATHLAQLPLEEYQHKYGSLTELDSENASQSYAIKSTLIAVAMGAAAFFSNTQLSSVAPQVSGLATVAFGVLAGVCLVGGMVISQAIRRWKPDKLLNARKWAAYRNFLSDFSMIKNAPAEHLQMWDYHFVYATALGVSKEYLRHIGTLAETQDVANPPWIVGMHTGSHWSDNLSDLQEALEQNFQAVNDALKPETSSGGGFSGSSMGDSSGGDGSSGAD